MLLTLNANALSSSWLCTAPSGQTLRYYISTNYPREAMVTAIDIDGPTGALVIPSSILHIDGENIPVTSIGYFSDLDSLTSVSIPESVTEIIGGTFRNCTALSSINIPSSVTTIGNETFQGCISLTSIEIPSGVTSIGSMAFQNTGLESIIIANASIGTQAFEGCLQLTSVSIGDGVADIATLAFAKCPALTSISVSEANAAYDCREDCHAIIETSTNTLISGCQNTVIPSSISAIAMGAFAYCSNLTSINIPYGVTSIGEGAFIGCSGLTSIDIPNTITSFEPAHWVGGLFQECSGLSRIVIPDSVTIIPELTFYGCSNLSTITIPDAVTHIEYNAFGECSGLTKVSIGTGLTECDGYAFEGCTNIDSVYCNAVAVNMEGGRIFDESNRISFLCLGNSVQNFSYTFSNLTELTTLILGSHITSIHNDAFYQAMNIETIVSRSPQPPQLSRSSFPNLENVDLYVPCGAEAAYQNSDWGVCNIQEQMLYSFDVVTSDSTMGNVQTTGTPSCESPQIEILAVANNGYRFARWSDGSTNAERTITITSDTTLTAYFLAYDSNEVVYYTLTVASDDELMGTVTGSSEVEEGDSATIRAIANEGYHFLRWNDNDTNAERTVVVTSDTTFTAYFEVNDTTTTGIGLVDLASAVIYPESGRVVVENAEGNIVTLYDAAGRILAIKQSNSQAIALDVPATGAYLVKVGNAPARRIVVVK